MPMQSPESERAAAALAKRVGADASATEVAVATVAAWGEINTALTPIIGSRGAAALYRRTLHLSTARHPWLSLLPEGRSEVLDASALAPLLGQRDATDALAASVDLLQTFQHLLATLIGASLTERLLRSVWTSPLSGPSAQDISP